MNTIEAHDINLDKGRIIVAATQVTLSLVHIHYTDGTAATTGGYLRTGRNYAAIGQLVSFA